MSFVGWLLQRVRRFWTSWSMWPEGERTVWVLTALVIASFGLTAISETLRHESAWTASQLVWGCVFARAGTKHWVRARWLAKRLLDADIAQVSSAQAGLDSVVADLAEIQQRLDAGYYDP